MTIIPNVHILRLTLTTDELSVENVPAFLQKLEKFLNEQRVVACGGMRVNVNLETDEATDGYMILNNVPDLEHKTGRKI